MKTEYEILRDQAEAEWSEVCGADERVISHARDTGARICAGLGTTPDRIWRISRSMRKEGGAK